TALGAVRTPRPTCVRSHLIRGGSTQLLHQTFAEGFKLLFVVGLPVLYGRNNSIHVFVGGRFIPSLYGTDLFRHVVEVIDYFLVVFVPVQFGLFFEQDRQCFVDSSKLPAIARNVLDDRNLLLLIGGFHTVDGDQRVIVEHPL